jgi:hypothetical protein
MIFNSFMGSEGACKVPSGEDRVKLKRVRQPLFEALSDAADYTLVKRKVKKNFRPGVNICGLPSHVISCSLSS